jgi:hypothetical protein
VDEEEEDSRLLPVALLLASSTTAAATVILFAVGTAQKGVLSFLASYETEQSSRRRIGLPQNHFRSFVFIRSCYSIVTNITPEHHFVEIVGFVY